MSLPYQQVGCSKTEGINGTLAGAESDVRAFTAALLPVPDAKDGQQEEQVPACVHSFRTSAKEFFASIGEDVLLMDSPDDFKWSSLSSSSKETAVFPDLHIRLVAELIGTGGVLSEIGISETAVGYLSPAEWHERLSELDNDDADGATTTVLIDCRNVKEHQIGHFRGALDPGTNTFEQFPKWVRDNSYRLQGKNVMMYCTGGIRCEKASAYIRKAVPGVQQVHHLRGGIHKYLEEFDTGEHWQGKNFVFDGRWAMPSQTDSVIGQCLGCHQKFDRFDPHCVCTICREPTLVCENCRVQLTEFHCARHAYLKDCFFTNLERFTVDELHKQLDGLKTELDAMAIGRKFKQRRKSILKQLNRVRSRIDLLENSQTETEAPKQIVCPKCGSEECPRRCWGWNGKQSANSPSMSSDVGNQRTYAARKEPPKQPTRPKRKSEDFSQSSFPPHQYRDASTGIRLPPCRIRTLECHIKAKWCSIPVLTVIQEQFFMNQPQNLQRSLENGLIKLNGRPLTPEKATTRLKTSDSLSRVVHWHEAPIKVPEQLDIQTVSIPQHILPTSDESHALVYVCNKPASIPVHPAGPYLANSLTLMVAAQLELPSVQPLHRIDRATSGLTLLCNSAEVARKFQQRLSEPKAVQKLYLAQVTGNFPNTGDEARLVFQSKQTDGVWKWSNNGCITVDASIHTPDPISGIRVVDNARGKSATSRFQRISFDGTNSLVACWLVSGRNHQLRVHLQWLGFPICGDVLYGGRVVADDACDKTSVLQCLEKALLKFAYNPDEASARAACPCCIDGIEKSFTDAQLLQAGHAIRLHALRYTVTFGNGEDSGDSLQFLVDPPDWVSSTDSEVVSALED